MENNNYIFMNDESLNNDFECMTDDFDTDMTLSNVNPWLLIAIYGNTTVA